MKPFFDFLSRFSFKEFMAFWTLNVCIAFLYYIVHLSQAGKLNNDTSQVMIAIIGLLGVISGYLWGSSSSSKEKDQLIKNLSATKAPGTNIESVNTLQVDNNNNDGKKLD